MSDGDLPPEREVNRRLGRIALLALAVSVVVVVALVVWAALRITEVRCDVR
jgi:hypothetical protein